MILPLKVCSVAMRKSGIDLNGFSTAKCTVNNYKMIIGKLRTNPFENFLYTAAINSYDTLQTSMIVQNSLISDLKGLLLDI